MVSEDLLLSAPEHPGWCSVWCVGGSASSVCSGWLWSLSLLPPLLGLW